ncbi:MAG: hypothetical protein AAB469_00355 [Patescibacteria group bacterium]
MKKESEKKWPPQSGGHTHPTAPPAADGETKQKNYLLMIEILRAPDFSEK